MKNITYSLSACDIESIKTDYKNSLNDYISAYKKNPSYYTPLPYDQHLERWQNLASNYAIFEQLKRDDLADIQKAIDEHYTFEDSIGDCFCHITNPDIDPKELKRQKINARSRFNRLGAYDMTLVIDGIQSDSIGGFVGNDFYGSGYDTDFYKIAIDELSNSYLEHIESIQLIIETLKRGTIKC